MTFSNFLDILWFLIRALFGIGILVFVVIIVANIWREDKNEDQNEDENQKKDR
jgi:hypothetical protein